MVKRGPSALAWGPARRAPWQAGTVVADPTGEFEAQRGRLFGLAYRLLGSAADAEDVVQDAFAPLERRRSRGDRRTGRLARQGGHELVPEPDVGGPRAARGLRRALAARAGADRRWHAWTA